MASAWPALLLSLKVASCATLVTGFTGTVVGWLLARRRSNGGEFVDAVLTLPLVLPPTVLGYYLLVLLGRHGVVGGWLNEQFGISLIFTWQGAVIAASVVSFPLVMKSARAAFTAVEPQYAMAARSLGLGEFAVLLRVSLPLAWPGILAGVLLSFARALGEFGATLMIAGSIPGRTQTLAVAVYDAVQAGDDESATILVLITSATCVVVLLAVGALSQRRMVATL